jgi:hypothetical protein
MADNILPFRKPDPARRHKGNTLCRNGHHKWRIWQRKQFDVKAGKLVTVYRCERCEAQKITSH